MLHNMDILTVLEALDGALALGLAIWIIHIGMEDRKRTLAEFDDFTTRYETMIMEISRTQERVNERILIALIECSERGKDDTSS